MCTYVGIGLTLCTKTKLAHNIRSNVRNHQKIKLAVKCMKWYACVSRKNHNLTLIKFLSTVMVHGSKLLKLDTQKDITQGYYKF